jgi:acyl-CoA synthetase (NDP forming)
MLGSANADSYRALLPILLGDKGVDAVIALFVPAVTATAAAVAQAIAEAAAGATDSGKPLLAAVMSAEGIPVPLRGEQGPAGFAYPESAARALGRVADRADWLRRPLGTVPDIDGVDRETASAVVERTLEKAEDRWLEPEDARKLLLAYGIPLVPEQTASSAETAVAAAQSLGFPVVVKTAAAGAHKTETGGIALDLTSDDAVRSAVERIGGPVIVQSMVSRGTELLAGLIQDPVFGPLVAFGPGGVLAELIGQASFRIAPLTDVDAEELVTDGKAGLLVRGFRGAPAADLAALVDLVHRLSRLGLELPAIAELDLNPVLALPDHCIAVDARVRIAQPAVSARTKTW